MLSCAAVITVAGSANFSLQEIPKESKTQPKEVVLDKDSQSDKYGDVAFNHENHATKMYSIDGKTVISCVECHHTDQPPAALKAPLKTSEREVALTAALLQAAVEHFPGAVDEVEIVDVALAVGAVLVGGREVRHVSGLAGDVEVGLRDEERGGEQHQRDGKDGVHGAPFG